MTDARERGRMWLRQRLAVVAAGKGLSVDRVQFVPNWKATGEVLVVRTGGGRQTVAISFDELEQLAEDVGEQRRMEGRLRDLLDGIEA
jgi:hypothetical protein